MNEKEAIKDARDIMQKFITKVETGRARSKETYAEMTSWMVNYSFPSIEDLEELDIK